MTTQAQIVRNAKRLKGEVALVIQDAMEGKADHQLINRVEGTLEALKKALPKG